VPADRPAGVGQGRPVVLELLMAQRIVHAVRHRAPAAVGFRGPRRRFRVPGPAVLVGVAAILVGIVPVPEGIAAVLASILQILAGVAQVLLGVLPILAGILEVLAGLFPVRLGVALILVHPPDGRAGTKPAAALMLFSSPRLLPQEESCLAQGLAQAVRLRTLVVPGAGVHEVPQPPGNPGNAAGESPLGLLAVPGSRADKQDDTAQQGSAHDLAPAV
jgi:hypothetical protein